MPLAAIILFSFVNVLNYFDRYLVGSVRTLIAADFNLSQEMSGWLFSSFVVGYVIFSPLFGYWGDRYQRPRLMALGVFLWSLATFVSGFAPGFMFFIAARIFIGVGEASFGSIAPGYIKDRLQNPLLVNRAFSIFYAAVPVGAALGYIVGGFLAQYWSWNIAFVVGGIPGIILSVVLLRSPEAARPPAQAKVRLSQGIRELKRAKLLWLMIAGYVMHSFALTGVATFISGYGEKLGFTLDEIGAYFGGFLLIAGFFGTFLGGALAARLAARFNVVTAGLALFSGASAVIAAPLLLCGFSVDSKFWFLAFCFLTEFIAFASAAPVNAIIVTACPPQLVTLTQGLSILFINLFGALPGPVLVGRIADTHSLRLGLQVLAIPLALAGVMWFLAARAALRDFHTGQQNNSN